MLTIKIGKDQKGIQPKAKVMEPKNCLVYDFHRFACLQSIKLYKKVSMEYLQFRIFSRDTVLFKKLQNCPHMLLIFKVNRIILRFSIQNQFLAKNVTRRIFSDENTQDSVEQIF